MEKLYLVFWEGDGCSRESASAYYTEVVEATSKAEAIGKVLPYVEKDFESEEQYKEELADWSAELVRKIIR
jgi:hypothetical protein